MKIDLRSFLEQFNLDKKARFVTNGGGFILEVNQAAADLFKSTIEVLKNKSLITFGARKKGCDAIRAVRDQAMNGGTASMPMVAMRPRGGAAFKANLTVEVLDRSDMLVLVDWKVAEADAKADAGDNAEVQAAE